MSNIVTTHWRDDAKHDVQYSKIEKEWKKGKNIRVREKYDLKHAPLQRQQDGTTFLGVQS
jgi:hypothetical protein